MKSIKFGAMQQLNASDARWIYLDAPESPGLMVSVYVFAPRCGNRTDEHAVADYLTVRARSIPVFRQQILRIPYDIDHPYWVEAGEVAMSEHVTSRRLAAGWEPLCDAIAAVASQPLNLDEPPWRLHVLTDLTDIPGIPDGSVAVVLQLHHSMTDGLGAVEIARLLFSTELPPQLESNNPVRPTPSLRTLLLVRGVARIPVRLGRLAAGFMATAVASSQSRKEAASGMYSFPTPVPRWAINVDTVGRARVFDAVTLRLSAVQTVTTVIEGVTVNDVMLATIGGALANYLSARGDAMTSSLMCSVPTVAAGPRVPGARNHTTFLLVNLHTDLPDIAERARAIRASILSERRRKASRAVQRTEQFADLLPAMTHRAPRRPRRAAQSTVIANTVVSTVPRGSGLELAGMPAHTTFGALRIYPGIGLAHMINTIDDVLTVSVTADPAVVSDLDHYVAILQTECEVLQADGQSTA